MVSALILAATLAFTETDARNAYEIAVEFTGNFTPRDAGTFGGRSAANYILDAVSARGADAWLDRWTAKTPLGEKLFTNVECEFVYGPDLPWIVLVSHYDTKMGVACPGANDGASTTALLIQLARELYLKGPQKCNIQLLWTDGEEAFKAYGPDDGFWGSRHAAEKWKKSGRKVRAVICLDMLGDKDLKITIPGNVTPGLKKAVLRVASHLGYADKVVASKELVKDDHVAFLEAGFKAITLIDFEYGSKPGLNDYWHTPRDTVENISDKSLFIAGNVCVTLLNGLCR